MKRAFPLILCVVLAVLPWQQPAPVRADDEPFPPSSFDPASYGRVSEEVMVLRRPAKPGDIIIWVERLAGDFDRCKYFQYQGVENGAILFDEVHTAVNIERKIDRVEGRWRRSVPALAGKKAHFETTDFYRKPFKAILTVIAPDGTLKVQGVQELEIPVFDFSE